MDFIAGGDCNVGYHGDSVVFLYMRRKNIQLKNAMKQADNPKVYVPPLYGARRSTIGSVAVSGSSESSFFVAPRPFSAASLERKRKSSKVRSEI